MTHEDIEKTVRSLLHRLGAIDAQGNRDVDAILAHFTDDLRYELPFLETPVALEGKAGFKGLIDQMQGVLSSTIYHVDRMTIDLRSVTAAVEARNERVLRANGEDVGTRFVFLFQLRNGLICQMREYAFSLDSGKIIAALGLDWK